VSSPRSLDALAIVLGILFVLAFAAGVLIVAWPSGL
jgi:hypothetical protein